MLDVVTVELTEKQFRYLQKNRHVIISGFIIKCQHIIDKPKREFVAKNKNVKKKRKSKKRRKRKIPRTKAQYREYLKSTHWKSFRNGIVKKRLCCERCGSVEYLQVHHKHYRSLWREKDEDVLLLCGICHEIEHGIIRGDLKEKTPTSS